MGYVLWTPQQILSKLGAWYFLRDANGVKAPGSQLTFDTNGNVLTWLDASGNNKTYTTLGTSYPKYKSTTANIGSTSVPSLSATGASVMLRTETSVPVELYVVDWCNNNSTNQFVTGAKRTTGVYVGDRFYLSENTLLTSRAAAALSNDLGSQTSMTLPNSYMTASLLDTQLSASSIAITRNADPTVSASAFLLSLGMSCVQMALFAGFVNGSVANNFTGEISEVVEIKTALTTSERDKLRGYLAWNNGLQTSAGGILPASHPYYAFPPILYYTTTANDLKTSSPVFQGAVFKENFALSATDTTTSAPVNAGAILIQNVILSPANTTSTSPQIVGSTIKQIVALTANSTTTGSPAISLGQFGFIINAKPQDTATSSPQITGANVQQTVSLSGTGTVTGSPSISTAAIATQANVSAVDLLTKSPLIVGTTLNSTYSISGSDTRISSPQLTGSTLTIQFSMQPNNTSVSDPLFDAATFAQVDGLTGNNLNSLAPIFTSSTLVQTVALRGQDLLVTSPSIDATTVQQSVALSASDSTTSNLTIDAADFNQTQVLAGYPTTTSSPRLCRGDATIYHQLTAQDLNPQPYKIVSSNVVENFAITASDTRIGAPLLDTTTLGQVHTLNAVNFYVGMTWIQGNTLNVNSMFGGDTTIIDHPGLSQGDFGQIHALEANDFRPHHCIRTSCANLAVIETLVADDSMTLSPIFDTPDLSVTYILSGDDTTTASLYADVLDIDQIVILHPDDIDITTIDLEDSDPLVQIINFVANDLQISDPVISSGKYSTTYSLGATSLKPSGISNTASAASQVASLTATSGTTVSKPLNTGSTLIQQIVLQPNSVTLGSPQFSHPQESLIFNFSPIGIEYTLGRPRIESGSLKRRRGTRTFKSLTMQRAIFPYWLTP